MNSFEARKTVTLIRILFYFYISTFTPKYEDDIHQRFYEYFKAFPFPFLYIHTEDLGGVAVANEWHLFLAAKPFVSIAKHSNKLSF